MPVRRLSPSLSFPPEVRSFSLQSDIFGGVRNILIWARRRQWAVQHQRTGNEIYSGATMRYAFAAVFAVVLSASLLPAAAISGEAVYKQRCASCHHSNSGRVPPRE